MQTYEGAYKVLYDPTNFQPPTFDMRFAGNLWDKLEQFTQPITVLVEPLHSWSWHVEALLAATGIGLVAGFAVYWFRGKGEMKHHARAEYLQRTLSDILTDVVEQAYYNDKITRAEKHQLYKRMASFFQAPDLIQTKNASRKKSEIRTRLGNGVYKHKPEIPGPTPLSIEEIKEKQVKPVRNRLTLRKSVARTQPV